MAFWERFVGRQRLRFPEWLVVGLGNPGPEYQRTRHNIGFWVADRLAQESAIRFRAELPRVLSARAVVGGCPVLLVKPLTFVNLSGQAIAPLLARFSLTPDRLLLICDDLDLPEGRVRVRAGGGSGGHRGVASVIEALGAQEFPRVRVGIGRPPGRMEPSEYVLEPLRAGEAEPLEQARDEAAEAVARVISEGLEAAMREYN